MRTILVVDDDPWIRALIRDILTHEGHRVLEAPDGKEALRLGAGYSGAIHLLLTDVVMPGLDGCELAARLCARRGGLRVMFMSAFDAGHLAGRGLAPRGPLIAKPFTISYLVRRVREMLDDRERGTPPVLQRSATGVQTH